MNKFKYMLVAAAFGFALAVAIEIWHGSVASLVTKIRPLSTEQSAVPAQANSGHVENERVKLHIGKVTSLAHQNVWGFDDEIELSDKTGHVSFSDLEVDSLAGTLSLPVQSKLKDGIELAVSYNFGPIQALTHTMREKLLSRIADKFMDPESVKFRDIQVLRPRWSEQHKFSVCGALNAKNSYGAYTGYQNFFLRSELSGDPRNWEKKIADITIYLKFEGEHLYDVYENAYCNDVTRAPDPVPPNDTNEKWSFHLRGQDRIFYSASAWKLRRYLLPDMGLPRGKQDAVFGTMDLHILLQNIYEPGPVSHVGRRCCSTTASQFGQKLITWRLTPQMNCSRRA